MKKQEEFSPEYNNHFPEKTFNILWYNNDNIGMIWAIQKGVPGNIF